MEKSLDGLLDRLVYLSAGLSLTLAFIEAKLVLHFLHLHDSRISEIPTGASLLVIVLILVITTVASALGARRDPAARAHAGSLRATSRRRGGRDERPPEPVRHDESHH